MVVAVGCTVLQMWRGVVPWALQVRVLRDPVVTGHVAIPDPPGQSAGVCTKEVQESHGDPGPLEGGGPGLRLLAPGVPLRGARGNAGPLPKQGRARGHTCGKVESG